MVICKLQVKIIKNLYHIISIKFCHQYYQQSEQIVYNMIIYSQQNSQQPVLYSLPKRIFSISKLQIEEIANQSNHKKMQKIKNILSHKRNSCISIISQNIDKQNPGNHTQAIEPPDLYSNKRLLEHILGQVKENYKNLYKHKEHKIKQMSTNSFNDCNNLSNNIQIINLDKNLKICTKNSLVIQTKRMAAKTNRLITFQNKKLMNLKKGRSFKMYSQQIQIPQDIKDIQKNQDKFIPWEQSPDNLFTFKDQPKLDDSLEHQTTYLKSNMKMEQPQPKLKLKTISIAKDNYIQRVDSRHKKRCSTLEIHKTVISQDNNKNRTFTHCIYQPKDKLLIKKQPKPNKERAITTSMIENTDFQKIFINTIKNEPFSKDIKTPSNKKRYSYIYKAQKNQNQFRKTMKQQFIRNLVMNGIKL